jgi:hypothetical protein
MRDLRRSLGADGVTCRTRIAAMALGLIGLAASAQGPPPALGLHVSLPYSAYSPGEKMTLYLIVRNRSEAPVAVPPSVEVRVESVVDGRAVPLEAVEAPPERVKAEDAAAETILPPGGHLVRPVALHLDRSLFLPGRYPLRITWTPPGGRPLTAEASLTVRYKRVYFY